MACCPPPPPKTLIRLLPPSSSKLRTTIQTSILSHLHRISRTLTKAKTLFIRVLKNIHAIHIIGISMNKNKNKKKIFLGSFRLHYNWCSSRISRDGWSNGSFRNTLLSTDPCDDDSIEDEDARLSGYLHWLERKAGYTNEEDSVNEIDRLADMFIANSHEKFRLEKQESDRKFQEMMARSV